MFIIMKNNKNIKGFKPLQYLILIKTIINYVIIYIIMRIHYIK